LYLLFEELIHEYRITSKYRNILFRAGGYGWRLYSGDEAASIVNMPLAISAIKKAVVYKLSDSRDVSPATICNSPRSGVGHHIRRLSVAHSATLRDSTSPRLCVRKLTVMTFESSIKIFDSADKIIDSAGMVFDAAADMIFEFAIKIFEFAIMTFNSANMVFDSVSDPAS
jgi:hypothetical protein